MLIPTLTTGGGSESQSFEKTSLTASFMNH